MKEILALLERLAEEGLERAFKLYYGSYRAYVFDSNDPQDMGRLKLIIPVISKDKPLQKWAYQKDRYSGKNYGSWNIPEKGEMVWVEFEYGNLNYPIWTYGYHGKNELEKEWANPQHKWFKTPDGFYIRYKSDEKVFELVLPNGQKLVIKDNISLVTEGKIFLGKLEEAAEPALLGDKTEEALNEIMNALGDIKSLLTEISTTDSAIASTLGLTYPTQIGTTFVPAFELTLASIENKISQIKSTKVRLD
jgi:hypothetical protein